MPPTGARRAAFIKARWSSYVDMIRVGTSRSKLANVMEISTSRVAKWERGHRLVKPETAWQVGERVTDYGIECGGGPTALWACGYIAELIELLVTLALDLENDGPRLAIMWFCGLPRAMLHFEASALLKTGKLTGGFSWHDGRRFSIDFDLEGKDQALTDQAKAIHKELNKPPARRAYAKAWAAVMKGTEPHTRFREKAPKVRIEDIGGVVTRAMMEDNAMLAQVIIDAARALSDADPGIVAMRAWRMLCEWAYYVQIPTSLFLELRPLLPTVYRTYENRDLTQEEIEELQRIDYMRDQWRDQHGYS